MSKTTVRGGKIQYGFHDGRSILAESETDLSPGDVCLLEVPAQKILRVVALKKGILALAVKGKRAGKIGHIKELRPGTFTKPKMADFDIEGVVAELPADMVFAVGDEKPLVTVTGSR
jgi:small subunit ribosomal protein S4e